MYQLFKKVFIRTNDCIITGIPLILFLSLIICYFSYAKNNIDTLPKLLLSIVTLLVMVSGCFAGWFYMLKKALNFSGKTFVFDKDRAKALWSLVIAIPKGMGKFFYPLVVVNLIQFILYSSVLAIIFKFLDSLLGSMRYPIFDIGILSYDFSEFLDLFLVLPQSDLIYCKYLLCIFSIVLVVIGYFTLLWIPVIIYEFKNPYSSLFIAIKRSLEKPLNHLIIYIVILFLLYFISYLIIYLLNISILFFILLLILYYYLFIFITSLLFTYYSDNFITGTKYE